MSGVFIVNSTGVTTVKDNLYHSTPSERNTTHFASKRINGTVINDLTMVWVDCCIVDWGKHQKPNVRDEHPYMHFYGNHSLDLFKILSTTHQILAHDLEC